MKYLKIDEIFYIAILRHMQIWKNYELFIPVLKLLISKDKAQKWSSIESFNEKTDQDSNVKKSVKMILVYSMTQKLSFIGLINSMNIGLPFGIKIFSKSY